MKIICPTCGKQFDGNTSARYCSADCRKKARNDRVSPKSESICQECNKAFVPTKSDAKYCSKKCRRSANYKRNKEQIQQRRIEKYWENPEYGRQKTKEWRNANPEKWKKMNDEYHDKTRYGGNREKCFERDGYKCVNCGSTEQLIPHHKDGSGQTDNPNHALDNLETLCRKCHMALHDPNPNKRKRIKCICLQCGTEFEETPSRVKSGRGKFCSRECRKKYGYMK